MCMRLVKEVLVFTNHKEYCRGSNLCYVSKHMQIT